MRLRCIDRKTRNRPNGVLENGRDVTHRYAHRWSNNFKESWTTTIPLWRLKTLNAIQALIFIFDTIGNNLFNVYILKCLAMEQSITIQNTTKIPCQVKTKVRYYDYFTPDRIESEYTIWIFVD